MGLRCLGDRVLPSAARTGHKYSERYYGAFERRIPLEGVQEDKAEADFRNGVLTVNLPKTEQASQNVKRITINTN
jgi:HSP20 family protein